MNIGRSLVEFIHVPAGLGFDLKRGRNQRRIPDPESAVDDRADSQVERNESRRSLMTERCVHTYGRSK